ncbi:tyrosine-type recombinase/integrase [Sphingomonas sp. MG17]|uniref:Tyrosine-type recombinase/integrase n=1 Tax=Sphingomonas tagetis TaxID=2949092 RepID=A0A9X2KKG4_9SPHN|nr:site-specific integrase [Sphingomonas tagetis]MCP3729730.1 tyrosine-type recombinase/integrase [Sphingomonas tagetis]
MARLKFTDKWVSNCAPPRRGRAEHSDCICPGLYLRVTCNGVKTFSVLIRSHRLMRHTLGRYPIIGLADARREAMDLLRKAAELGGQALEPVTLSEIVSQYEELHLKPNVSTWKSVASSLKQAAMQPLLRKQAAKVKAPDVVAVLDTLVAAGKPHAAVNLLKALRAMYNFAVDRGVLTANPCANVRPPVRTTQRDRILNDGEIAAVLQACDKVPAPFGDIVRMLLMTGARRNEVAQMRWIELSGNIWTLPAARSKSNRANVLPLPPAAMALLAQLPRRDDDDGYVFTTTGGAKPFSGFSKAKALLDQASGVQGFTIHDLRRTTRSKLSELGVPWEVARRIVGHSVDQLDAVYDRFNYLDAKGEALARLADHYAGLGKV